jgi:hypothetical protein
MENADRGHIWWPTLLTFFIFLRIYFFLLLQLPLCNKKTLRSLSINKIRWPWLYFSCSVWCRRLGTMHTTANKRGNVKCSPACCSCTALFCGACLLLRVKHFRNIQFQGKIVCRIQICMPITKAWQNNKLRCSSTYKISLMLYRYIIRTVCSGWLSNRLWHFV